MGEAANGCLGFELREQGAFTEIAAVGRVVRHTVHTQDVGRNHYLLDAVRQAEGLGFDKVCVGDKDRADSETRGLIAQHVVGHLEQQRRVNASREGHRQTAQLLELLLQGLVLAR